MVVDLDNTGPCIAFENGGARLQNDGSHKVKSACAAEIFIKMGLKSTILELQRSFKYKRSCLSLIHI